MTFSEHCPCGQLQPVTPGLGDIVAIDRQTFRQIFSLLNRSTDILATARHREIFLTCLDGYLSESVGLDDSQCFKASLLLDAWIEHVPASLAQLGDELEEARQIMHVIFAASQLGG